LDALQLAQNGFRASAGFLEAFVSIGMKASSASANPSTGSGHSIGNVLAMK
jgi:hypothetical protein